MFPRSEALVKATRDFDRKRISENELIKILRNQQLDLISFQKKQSIKVLSDGLLNWQDHFRPLSDFFSGISLTTLTRFTNTNTFFRRPQINGNISFKKKSLQKYFHGIGKSGKWVAFLPAPFYFVKLANDKFYKSQNKIYFAYSMALANLINNLKRNNYCSFRLFDPYLGYLGASNTELQLIVKSLQEITKSTKVNIDYQTAYKVDRKIIESLLKTDLNAIGIDFYHTDISSVPSFHKKKVLIASCIDSRSSLVENTNTLSKFLKMANEKISPSGIIATSNLDLQFVTSTIAVKKINNLKLAVN